MSDTPRYIDFIIRETAAVYPDAERDALLQHIVDAIPADDYEHHLKALLNNRVSSALAGKGPEKAVVRPGVSTKQSLIRDDYWPRFLAQMVTLPSGIKRMADVTSEDLRFMADLRRTQANDLLNRAEQFVALAHIMDEEGTRVLGQLNQSAADRVLAGAA